MSNQTYIPNVKLVNINPELGETDFELIGAYADVVSEYTELVASLGYLPGDGLVEGRDYAIYVSDPWKYSELLFQPGKSEAECQAEVDAAMARDPWRLSSESAFGNCGR